MPTMRASQHPESQCPVCGNTTLPEFSTPAGVALCPQCGSLLRRSARGMLPVGVSSETLVRAVASRVANGDRQRVEERVREAISKRLGVEADALLTGRSLADLGADSLDVVEVVMALEEEFGIEIELD